MLDHIFEAYDAVLVLDTETTGISCRKDEIIELAVLKAGQDEAGLLLAGQVNEVLTILLQGIVGVLGVVVGHALVAAHGGELL